MSPERCVGVTQIISFEFLLLKRGETAFVSVTIETMAISGIFLHLRLGLQSCELEVSF